MQDDRQALIEPANESSVQSHKIRANGYSAHFLKAGSGPSVILIHGGASDSGDWVATMTALSHSYTLHAPDLLGYGLSDRLKGSYRLSEFVDFTLAFLGELDFERHTLVGHSIGGRVCLEIALRHPELVQRLVLIDTAGFGRLARWGLYISAFMYWFRKMLRMEQPYPRFLKDDGEDKDWRCTRRLSSLKIPTLVIWNSHDPYYPVTQAFRAKKLIPHSRLEVFSGYGHSPHIKERGQFNNLLLDFLKQN